MEFLGTEPAKARKTIAQSAECQCGGGLGDKVAVEVGGGCGERDAPGATDLPQVQRGVVYSSGECNRGALIALSDMSYCNAVGYDNML